VKNILIPTVLLLTLSTPLCMASGHMEVHSYSPDGTVYTFEVYTGSVDEWDSTKDDHPPLAPKRAMAIATEFVKKISLGENMRKWELQTITLRRMSKEPEHWLYLVHFDAVPKAEVWNGPVPWFEIVVRMDGSIPINS